MNINGQTLHSTFSFSFGDDHYSLPDQKRDIKRAMFKNLQFLIIDEVSMVKADQVSSDLVKLFHKSLARFVLILFL